MIRWLYGELGFFPSLFITTGMVVFIIFWLAGIAGLISNPDRENKAGNFTLVLCVLFPPFPVIWLLFDMARQHSKIRRNQTKGLKSDSV